MATRRRRQTPAVRRRASSRAPSPTSLKKAVGERMRAYRARHLKKAGRQALMDTGVTQLSCFGASMARGYLGPVRSTAFGIDMRLITGGVGTAFGLMGAIGGRGSEFVLPAATGVLASYVAEYGQQVGRAVAEDRPIPSLTQPTVRGWGQPIDFVGAYDDVDDDVDEEDDEFDYDEVIVEGK